MTTSQEIRTYFRMDTDSNDRTPDDKTIQNHTGTGDNVGIKVVITQSNLPNQIQTLIKNILTSIRHRKFESSKHQLELLQSTPCLTVEVNQALPVLQVLVASINDGIKPSRSLTMPDNHLDNSSDAFLTDIALSAKIRIDARAGRQNDARERFVKNPDNHAYANEAYYETTAAQQEIQEIYQEQRIDLSEVELCGLIRGALRCNDPSQALKISGYLNEKAQSFNSRALKLISEYQLFISQEGCNHYWCTTSAQHHKLNQLCEEVIALINDCKGEQSRILFVAISLMDFTFGTHEALTENCWKFISKIESLNSDLASKLRLFFEKSPSIEGVYKKFSDATEDEEKRRNIVNTIIESLEISYEDAHLLAHLAEKEKISDWLSSGGKIESSDPLERDYSALQLSAFAAHESSEELETQLVQFISKYSDSIKLLAPVALLNLSSHLLTLNLPFYVSQLLAPHVPKNDAWPSPLVICYLDSLLKNEQLLTLTTALNNINQN